MKIYELIYIWEDEYDGLELTDTRLYKDRSEVDKEIESFCEQNKQANGILFDKDETCISYEFIGGFSKLFINEHELCD